MNIKLINGGQEAELVLEGRLDSMTSQDAEDIFLKTAERFEKLTLNMEGVEYISSAGLRVIKRLYMAMNKKGGSLTLSNVRKMVMEVFEMTGFVGFLTIK
jgi:anti-sigma B factor antagonist